MNVDECLWAHGSEPLRPLLGETRIFTLGREAETSAGLSRLSS